MPITGFTPDSTTNGVQFVITAKTGLTAAITGESVCISGAGKLQGAIDISQSAISFTSTLAGNGSTRGQTSPLSYTNTNVVTNTTPLVRIRDQSSLTFIAPGRTSAMQVIVSEISNSVVSEHNNNTCLIYLQPGGVLENTSIQGINWLELAGSVSKFANINLIDTQYGIFNYEGGRIDLLLINIPSTKSNYQFALGDGNSGNNSFHFWNKVNINLNSGVLMSAANKAYEGYTISWRFKDVSGNIPNVVVNYRETRFGFATALIAAYSTNANGILTGNFDTKLRALGSNTQRPTLWVRTKETIDSGTTKSSSGTLITWMPTVRSFTVQNIDVAIEIKSYLHTEVAIQGAPTSEIGKINADESINFYSDFLLFIDAGITQTNTAIVANYSGIAHSISAVTVSASHSLAEVYDSRKWYWRNTGGVSCPSFAGGLAHFGGLDLTITNGGFITASDKFQQGIELSGVVTLETARAYVAPMAIGVGGSVRVTSGLTQLLTWTFAPGTAINNTSASPATVYVSSDQIANVVVANPTIGGGSITIQTPPATLRLYGIPNVVNAILRIEDTVANTVTFPALANGEATIEVIEGRAYRVRADAPGYQASRFITITGSEIAEFEFNLNDYRSLYLSGTNISSQVVFNPVTYEITISDAAPSISFADIVRTLEDYFATEAGTAFTAQPYPVTLPSKSVMWFPYDALANQVNPARVKPAAGNTTDPDLLFEVYLEGAANPIWDLFDFSDAAGRILRVNAEVAIANVQVSGGTGGGATPEQIWSYTGTGGRSLTDKSGFAPTLTSIVEGVAGLLTGLAQQTGLDTLLSRLTDTRAAKLDRNLAERSDVQVTVDGGFTNADRSNLANLPQTVASAIDKTGYSLSPTERSAIATAVEAALINDGDGQQLINAILQIINSNLDLPALELQAIAQAVRSNLATELTRISSIPTNPLLASVYTPPDNATIAQINAKTSQLQFESGKVEAVVGVTALNPQEVRDAMLLAPSGIAEVEAGSIDAQLGAIDATVESIETKADEFPEPDNAAIAEIQAELGVVKDQATIAAMNGQN
jgi:hypothetical protein